MQHIKGPIDQFMDEIGQKIFGKSRSECWAKGICIDCGELALPKCTTEAGRKEYAISCLCEPCFDSITNRKEGDSE